MNSHRKTNRNPESSRARNRRLAIKQANKLTFDGLEDRQLLAAVTVGNATDLVNADTSSISALIDNGGPTLTHALLDGSPAVNAGDNIQMIAIDAILLTTDQRGSGFDQIQNGTVDIGAFESNFDAVVPPTIVSVTINEGGVLARPDLWNTLTVVFDRDVDVSADALTLFNDLPTGNPLPLDLTGFGFSYNASTNTATWDFNTLDPLLPGIYTYQLDANSITAGNVTLDGNGDGVRGDDFVDQHYVAIPGDANLDGRVDVLNDAFSLINNLNTTTGESFADADFNADGRVDILGDAFILVANLNRNVDLVTNVVVSNNTDLVNGDTSSVFALIADDGGDGISLREAIIASDNAIGSGTVTFDGSVFSGGSKSLIRLTQGELEITDGLAIDASSATDVTITGDANGDDVTVADTFITNVGASFGGAAGDANDLLDDNSRVFNFSSLSGDLTLTGLTLTGGRTTENYRSTQIQPTGTGYSGGGGGIRFFSNGTLTIESSRLSGNSTSRFNASGGAIYTFFGGVSLTDSTLSGNRTSGSDANGGGIFTVSGNVSLISSTLNDNGTSGNSSLGGGIGTQTGNVLLTDSEVTGNTTTGSYAGGGGIATFCFNSNKPSGSSVSSGSISLVNSTVSGNSTFGRSAKGGGIRAGSGEVLLTDSVLSGNSTAGIYAGGGGIYSAGGNVALVNSTLSQNSTTGTDADGGGIRTTNGGVSLTSSTLSNNSTVGNSSGGGGIFAYGVGSYFTNEILLTNSTISGNFTRGTLSPGGGVSINGADVRLTNSTFSGNSSLGILSAGGAIYSQGGSVSLNNSTVTENNAGNNNAGGISVSGLIAGPFDVISVTIQNSIVAGNTDNGSAPDLLGFQIDNLLVEHSLIGDTAGSGVTTTTGTGNILNQPALLAPLADNGGATLTHALLDGSPAIDAGNNTLAMDEDDVPQANDQRGEGFDRVFGSSVDIGAFELQSIAVPAQFALAGDNVLVDDVFGSEF